MSSAKCSSARWRKKKLEEDAQQFRAKEALRLRIHRARTKAKAVAQARGQEVFTLRNANADGLSDDLDAWFDNVVEDHCRSRSSHVLSSCPNSPPSPSTDLTHSSRNSHKKDDCHTCRSNIVTLQDAHNIISNGQKTLHDWNKRWGTATSFPLRVVNAFLEFGLVTVPVDSAQRELTAIIRNGRDVLVQLESIAFVNLQSILANDFPNLWIEAIRIVAGIQERIIHANVALRLCSDYADCYVASPKRTPVVVVNKQ